MVLHNTHCRNDDSQYKTITEVLSIPVYIPLPCESVSAGNY